MKFDVARQSLVPAFFTLLLLTVAALWGAGGGVPAAIPAAVDMPLTPPDDFIVAMEASHPVLSRWIAGFFLVFGAVCTGRITIRYNLYTVGTCLSIPLCGIMVCALTVGEAPLASGLLLTTMALAIKHFGRSFSSGYAFDAIFRAAIYLSLTVLIEPTAVPVLLLLPLALILFGRTLREAVVAVTGAVLPVIAVCYLNWAAGGGFTAPLQHIVLHITEGEWLSFLQNMAVWRVALMGIFVILTLFAVMVFSLNRYSASTKSRYLLSFNGCAFAIITLLLLTPMASKTMIVLLAPSVAILLPVMFIRVSRAVSLPLYLLLLIAGFAGAIF